MPPAAKDAFREFWEATYAGVKKPRQGWPEEVKVCLRAAFGEVEDKAVKETVIDPALLVSEAASVSTSTTHEADSAKHDSPPVTPTKPMSANPKTTANKSKKCTPSRPHKVNFYTQFPLRSHKSPVPCLVPAAFSPAPSFPSAKPLPAFSAPSAPKPPVPNVVARPRTPSPSPSTPRRARMRPNSMRPNVFKSMHIPTPATPKRSPGHVSPAKRRKIGDGEDDKENELPSRHLIRPSSVAVAEKECAIKPFILGKRARKEENGNCGEMSPQKKGRVTMREPEDSEDERLVESLVIPGSDDSFIAILPASKKRKRVFMDAVVVPRLKDVYPQFKLRSTSSLSSLKELCTPSSSCPSSHQKGQTRSMTKALVTYACASSRKRKRASAEDVFSVSATFSDSESDPEIFSDSFTLDKRPQAASPKELPSSDDDPHIGQVTPHRLISPVPRRTLSAKFYEIDPPSDDSVMGGCASPSKEVVERRLKRLGSESMVMMSRSNNVLRMNGKPSGV
jgi:hypothetical protein